MPEDDRSPGPDPAGDEEFGDDESGDDEAGDACEDPAGADEAAGDTPPADVVNEAERLTRLAREAVDDAAASAYRSARAEALADHDYVARVREEDDGAVLVCHPADWVEDGVIRPERIDDLDRGVERRIAGPGEPDAWDDVEAHNRELASTVEAAHGEVHGENAHALADFMSNHYAKPVEDATGPELEEFLDEYFPRNAFPSDAQRDKIEESVALVFEAADEPSPLGG